MYNVSQYIHTACAIIANCTYFYSHNFADSYLYLKFYYSFNNFENLDIFAFTDLIVPSREIHFLFLHIKIIQYLYIIYIAIGAHSTEKTFFFFGYPTHVWIKSFAILWSYWFLFYGRKQNSNGGRYFSVVLENRSILLRKNSDEPETLFDVYVAYLQTAEPRYMYIVHSILIPFGESGTPSRIKEPRARKSLACLEAKEEELNTKYTWLLYRMTWSSLRNLSAIGKSNRKYLYICPKKKKKLYQYL